jgi:NAD(P)-dependent dehydrogenase (short-subunit alcohol dehydrogenase family)
MAAERKNRQNILVTGGTSGLGLELARKFMSAGNKVWITGRNLRHNDAFGEDFHFLKTDFADLRSVSRTLSEVLEAGLRFDIVINNAGVLGPPSYIMTGDGFEYTFQVNYLAHLLVSELIAHFTDNDHHILFATVTSPVYKFVKPVFRIPEREKYRSFRTYSESKYYLLLITKAVCSANPGKKITGFAFNPGIFNSGIYRTQAKWFHRLYKFASPVLKDPGKVADKFMGVLYKGNFPDSAIYKSVNSYSLFCGNCGAEHEIFMNECRSFIAPYLPASRL